MARVMIALAVTSCALIPALGAYCNGRPSANAAANDYKINTQTPQMMKSSRTAKAYQSGQPGFEFWILHLWGNTSYDYGFAQGALMKEEIQVFTPTLWNYILNEAASGLEPTLPAWIADIITSLGLDAALDVLIDITKPFTGEYIYEELRGIADGADVDYQTLCRIHLFGELTQGSCTMIGAWGKASADGNVLQLRALDWDTDGPFKDYPTVVVYHMDEEAHPELGHSWANVGFLAWVGLLTGIVSTCGDK